MKSPAPLHVASISTKLGEFTACFSTLGLVSLHFPDRPAPSSTSRQFREPAVRQLLAKTREGIRCVFAGKPIPEFPKLDLSAGTKFQQEVWRELINVPLGKTVSYGELAARIKRPRASRAVGQACGANPIPLLIPCHRVLGAMEKLGGFSAGLHWKQRLLQVEGISWQSFFKRPDLTTHSLRPPDTP